MSEPIKQDGDTDLPQKREPNSDEASARSQSQDELKNPSALPAEEHGQDAGGEQFGKILAGRRHLTATINRAQTKLVLKAQMRKAREAALEPPSAETAPFDEPLAETPANPPDLLGLPQEEAQPAGSVERPDEPAGPAPDGHVTLESALVSDSLEGLADPAADEPALDEPSGRDEANVAELEDGTTDQPSVEIGDPETDTVRTEDDRSLYSDSISSRGEVHTLEIRSDDPPPTIEWGPYFPGDETRHGEQLPYFPGTGDLPIEHAIDRYDPESGRGPLPDTEFDDRETLVQAAPVFVTVSLADSQIEQLIDAALGKSAARDLAALGELADSAVEHSFWLRNCHERALNG